MCGGGFAGDVRGGGGDRGRCVEMVMVAVVAVEAVIMVVTAEVVMVVVVMA